jgi:hypothetical protein
MKYLLILITPLFLFHNSNAQGMIKLGAGGGLSIVTGPAGFTSNISSYGAGFGTEYHFSLRAKLDDPIEQFKPKISLLYYTLNGAEFISTVGYVTTSLDIVSLGAGGEIPIGRVPFNPHFDIEVNLNHFGQLKNNIVTSDSLSTLLTLPAKNRVGVTIGFGGTVKILPLIDLDVGVAYTFLNIYGRGADEATISIVNLDATVYFTLF